jgi:hypothetical protein
LVERGAGTIRESSPKLVKTTVARHIGEPSPVRQSGVVSPPITDTGVTVTSWAFASVTPGRYLK